MSSNECNERVNTRLFARASLWANNVSRNTWSPSSLLFMHTQTRAYMGKIPRKFALAMVNRCPAKKKKKTRSTVVNKFSCCKNFSFQSHSRALLCLSASKLFHTGKFTQGREVYEKLRPPNGKSASSLPLFFFFRKNAWKRKEKGRGGISTSRQIKMNPKITRSSTAYVRITNESPECEYLSTISSESWVLFLVLIILYG